MANIMSFAPLASLVLFVVYLSGVFIAKLIKHKSIKKAIEETKKEAEEIRDIANSEAMLMLREKCKDGIYAVEKMYSTYNSKAGAFKLDSLLKDMQVECIKANVEYDKEYWTKFITEEVTKMKGVK